MFDATRRLLDEAAEAFHRERDDRSPDRAHQFDSHLATARMAVDHAEHEIQEQ